MPAYDELLMLETQSERLGHLWRSQGQDFLDEQAAQLQEDVNRLRDAYVTGVPAEPAPGRAMSRMRPTPKPKADAKVIDLRQEPEILPGWICSTDGHALESAVARCSRCHGIFCQRCILQAESTQGRPLCLECALVLGGVHHKRMRPLRVR
jgi:hypothetical protein